MKILRLSLFNLKRHKKETNILIFLSLFIIALLCLAINNYSKVDEIRPSKRHNA